MTKFARRVDAIPVVASTTERDALYPTPERDQRVEVRSTGEVQRYGPDGWEALPGNFYAEQRARGIHWVTDPEHSTLSTAAASCVTAVAGSVTRFPAAAAVLRVLCSGSVTQWMPRARCSA